jgi:purine-nucleoside phosphorylase
MGVHIDAKAGSVAEHVLLCGDPLRAKHIAQTFFDDPVCYNEVRGMYGYTGYWEGHRVSVQGTGMGMPSVSIYVHELVDDCRCRNLIRVGTCGTITEKVRIRQVVIAQSADSDGGMNQVRFGSYRYAPTASFRLLQKAWSIALEKKIEVAVGRVFTSDRFYDEGQGNHFDQARALGALAVEMETSELYTLSSLKRFDALSLLTVSDSVLTGEHLPPLERQGSFDEMVRLALHVFFD